MVENIFVMRSVLALDGLEYLLQINWSRSALIIVASDLDPVYSLYNME